MTKKLIIGFAGEIASGKTFSTRYLVEKYHAASYRFSTPLRQILERIYIDPTRDNLQTLSKSLRDAFGEAVLAKVIAEDVHKSQEPIIVIDGVRRLEDIAQLRQLPEFKLVYIETDLKIRYERITKRGENADDYNKTWEQFQSDQKLEAETQIRSLKEVASVVIENDGEEDELRSALDRIIKSE